VSEPTLNELLEDLANGSQEDRRYAAEDLGDLGDPAAILALVRALRDPAVAVREAAADALITIGGQEVARVIVHLLDDDDSSVRNLALEVFERLRSVAIPLCIELYQSSSSDLRKVAVDTLGKIEETRNSEGFSVLVKALDDPHVNVATAACEALGRLGGEESIAALASHLGRHPLMDATIFLSLARIGTQEAREALEKVDKESLDPIAKQALDAALEMFLT